VSEMIDIGFGPVEVDAPYTDSEAAPAVEEEEVDEVEDELDIEAVANELAGLTERHREGLLTQEGRFTEQEVTALRAALKDRSVADAGRTARPVLGVDDPSFARTERMALAQAQPLLAQVNDGHIPVSTSDRLELEALRENAEAGAPGASQELHNLLQDLLDSAPREFGQVTATNTRTGPDGSLITTEFNSLGDSRVVSRLSAAEVRETQEQAREAARQRKEDLSKVTFRDVTAMTPEQQHEFFRTAPADVRAAVLRESSFAEEA
jgi:hypothetical protein